VTGAAYLYLKAAAIIRARVEDGTYRPGQPVPSGAELARLAGCSTLTARKGLRALVGEGVLVEGVTRTARHRVPVPAGPEQDTEQTRRVLSSALSGRRRAAGLTQPDLAAKIGVPVTTVGHAETGRLWQSARFWRDADDALGARGRLVQLHEAYRAAKDGRPTPAVAGVPLPAGPSITEPRPVLVITVWSSGEVTYSSGSWHTR
jgi:DNA-binding transcriptional regulator YhcF (GntR family)